MPLPIEKDSLDKYVQGFILHCLEDILRGDSVKGVCGLQELTIHVSTDKAWVELASCDQYELLKTNIEKLVKRGLVTAIGKSSDRIYQAKNAQQLELAT